MSEQEQAPQQAGLSLNDISAAVQVIDMASGRGAVRGDELLAVGTVRERLVAFLRAAQEQGQEVNIPGEEPAVEDADEVEAEDEAIN